MQKHTPLPTRSNRRHRRGDFARQATFDAAAHPIIARHFFAVGPLVPIGQALPAVFANLARTMAANTNSPQNHRNKDMNQQEIESLNTIINLFWRDERKHFEECELNGDDPGDHIFRHVDSLNGYLLREHNADAWASASSTSHQKD